MKTFIQILQEKPKTKMVKGVKMYWSEELKKYVSIPEESKGDAKLWKAFERAAKKEIKGFDGNVTGDVLDKVSKSTRALYTKYFDSIK